MADKHKEQISAINYQSKRNKQRITDITSELQNISKLYPCDITSSPDTGSSITHILDTNNQVNNKQVSQQRIHSHTVTTEKINSNQSKSTDHPLTNFLNGEKSNTSTTFSHGEKIKPPIIFPNGENSDSENQELLNDKPNTHPSTDSIKTKQQTYDSPTKPIAETESCETLTHLSESSDQGGGITKEQLHRILMRPEICQVKLRILVNNSPITKPKKVSLIEPIATTDSCETPTYLDGSNNQVGAISKDTQNSEETQENQIPKTFLNSYKHDGTNHHI